MVHVDGSVTTCCLDERLENRIGNLVQTPFFYQDDGYNPSLEKWGCLQFFPRDGSPFSIAGASRSESDVRVMMNKPDAGERESVVNDSGCASASNMPVPPCSSAACS